MTPLPCGVLLTTSHQPAIIGDHRIYGRGDVKFPICHVTSRDQVIKGLSDIMGEFP